MIKLVLGKSTEVKEAICNFCGEPDVCAEAHYPSQFWTEVVSWNYNWRGFLWSKMTKEIDDIKTVTEERNVHICKNCAKQIAQQL